MINFINHTNEKFISDFFSNYEARLNSMCPLGMNFTVTAYCLDNIPSDMQESVDFLGDFIDNPCMCWPNPPISIPLKDILLYNPQIRVAYNLTDEEMYGLLAHEVGHYIFEYSNPIPSQDKEQFCDDIAVRIGLGKELKNALKKIIPICTPNLVSEVNNRIQRL